MLAINAAMFVGEVIGALLAQSSALPADSLDMFADAAVYGIALFGVHRARASQLKAAHISGGLQLLLALIALAEVVRRVRFGSEPEAGLMIDVAAVALLANATSKWLLARHRRGGAHMKPIWIFTSTDVIANAGGDRGGGNGARGSQIQILSPQPMLNNTRPALTLAVCFFARLRICPKSKRIKRDEAP